MSVAKALSATVLALSVGLAGCSSGVGSAATHSTGCTGARGFSERASGTIAFPLKVDAAHRELVDQRGDHLLMVGDAAWSFIAQLSDEDAATYLCSRRAAGFNTILVNLIEHKFASNAPADIRGEAPFTAQGDFTRPNAAYFDRAERLVALARSFGFLVLLTPAYAGYNGGTEGWYAEMAAMGPDRLRKYGRYLGQRFADHDNVVWVEGGDYDVPDPALVDALAQGIAEIDPGALQTYNGTVDSRVTPAWGDRTWFSLDNIYTYGRPADAAAAAYRDGDKPFFLLEAQYENEHDTTPLELRQQSYETVLSGGIGHVFGNNPMWHFDGPGLFPAPADWQDQLDSPGSRGMTQFGRILGGIAWWKLRPDTGTFINREGSTSDGSRGDTVAAVAPDGTLAVAYTTSGTSLQVNPSVLARPGTAATWRDPVSGAAVPADLGARRTDIVTMSPPGPNAGNDRDWVLVVQAG